MGVVITKDDIMAYAEVDHIIHHMNEKYLEMLPEKLVYFFDNIKDPEHDVYVDPRVPLQNQGLKKFTLEVIAILHLKYWCQDEDRRQELLTKMRENEEKLEAQMREKYSIDKLFDNGAQIIKSEADLEKEDFSKPRTVVTSSAYSQYTENNPDITDYTDLKEEVVEKNEEDNLPQKIEGKFDFLIDMFNKLKLKVLDVINKKKGVG